MFEFVTPHSLFRTQIHTLRTSLPGVLDGLENHIHEARIATRRIREVLPLLGDPKRKHLEDLRTRFRQMGRSLGRVRDADVRIALLASLEIRMPHAAPSLVVLRQQREEERLDLLRKLIKRLERIEAIRLVEMLDDHLAFPGSLARIGRAGRTWRRDLRYTVTARARATTDAINHATGVYFPNRAHAARIAIKKLRYAMEIAHETGAADRSAAIRELKKAQDVLGELHDRQELIDNLTAPTVPDTASNEQTEQNGQVSLLKQVIDAECRDLHGRYLARREKMLDICLGETNVASRSWSRALLTTGAVAVSTGIYARLR